MREGGNVRASPSCSSCRLREEKSRQYRVNEEEEREKRRTATEHAPHHRPRTGGVLYRRVEGIEVGAPLLLTARSSANIDERERERKGSGTNLASPVVLADEEDLAGVGLHPRDVLLEEPLEGGVEVVGSAREKGNDQLPLPSPLNGRKRETHTRSTSSTVTPVFARLPP